MKRQLNYGRIVWSYDESGGDYPLRPTPLIKFYPIRVHGKLKYPNFSDRTTLLLLKLKTITPLPFREAYLKWHEEDYYHHQELGEGRAFYRWLLRHQKSIRWSKDDFEFHSYFQGPEAPRHSADDELAKGLSFALKPVKVHGRKVKLYLEDESVLTLLSTPFGHEIDFLELVESYVAMRFELEKWQAPAPPFVDWVKSQAKRPVFKKGQLGFSPAIELAEA